MYGELIYLDKLIILVKCAQPIESNLIYNLLIITLIIVHSQQNYLELL